MKTVLFIFGFNEQDNLVIHLPNSERPESPMPIIPSQKLLNVIKDEFGKAEHDAEDPEFCTDVANVVNQISNYQKLLEKDEEEEKERLEEEEAIKEEEAEKEEEKKD